MNRPEIPQIVLQFLAQNIDTVPQIETLLLLREHKERLWTEDEVAARVYVTVQAAQEILTTLQLRELIVAEDSPPRFRYRPAQEDIDDVVAEVAATYRMHLVSVATFIHSKASASVREFARAFDLKKDR